MSADNGSRGADTGPAMTNPDIDVESPVEHLTGYDIEPCGEGLGHVFQVKQRYDSSSWILRWDMETRPAGDPELDLRREFMKAAESFGLTDVDQSYFEGTLPEAYIETPESSGYFEASQVADLLGALNSGFSLDEALEKNSRASGGGDYFMRVADGSSKRIYRVEIVGDSVLKGLEGYSRFRDADLDLIDGISGSDYEEIVEPVKRKTASFNSFRE